MDNIQFAENPQNASQKRIFTTAETVFAWVCIIAGYLFCRAYPATQKPFGTLIFTIFMLCVTAVIMALNNASFGVVSIISAVSALVVSFSLIFTQNSFIHFFAAFYCICAYSLFLYTGYGNHNPQNFSRLFPLDFLKALIVAPFKSLNDLGKGLVANGKLNTRPILKMLLGIIITVIPTAIIVLLLSYDSDFTDLLEKIFDFNIGKIFSHAGSFILGIPIGMYIYGGFISAVDKKNSTGSSEENVTKTLSTFKFVPQLTALSAIIPILAVYVLFFISQWKYYVSGFVGVLPDEFNYAQYARQGFFQLCTVSVINFILICLIGLLVKRKNKKPSVIERVLSVLLSLSTLILIATALAKMFMYIDIYGLTPKRVYATWFMLVLAVIFVLATVKQFATKLPLILISSCVAVVMFSFLAFAQTDKIIAEYNVDRYIDGTLDNVDVTMLKSLGDAAIPSMVRVLEYWSEEYNYDYKLFFSGQLPEYLQGHLPQSSEYWKYDNLCKSLKIMARNRDNNIWNYTLLKNDANKALKKIGLYHS